MQKKETYIYRGFERFWHWSQALLIFFLALTGFEIHGTFDLFGFENVVHWHNIAAIAFIVLIIFAIFWHFVTGEWKQYIPTSKYVKEQIEYYITGIFKGAPHPTHKTIYNKFNPLQRLIYLGLKLLVIPVQVITGVVYMFYIHPDNPFNMSGLTNVAIIHTFGAFLLLTFVVAHVYLTTTGDTPLSSIKAMITGWEVIDIDEKEARMQHINKAIEDSVAGYYRIDLDGNIVDVNDAWLRMYKCNNRAEIIGKHYSFSREESALDELNEIVNKVLKGESVTAKKAIRKCLDGSLGMHLLSANPVYDDNNKIIGMEGFILDIVEQEEFSEHVFNIVKDSAAGYYRLDDKGFIVDVNDAWLSLYKYSSKEEVIGKHSAITREPEDMQVLEDVLSKVLEGKKISGKISIRKNKDGSKGKHILSANPVYLGNKIVGMEGFILDISEDNV
jgi:PAS domain S-box-containing protein